MKVSRINEYLIAVSFKLYDILVYIYIYIYIYVYCTVEKISDFRNKFPAMGINMLEIYKFL